jgi:FMN-binding domain
MLNEIYFSARNRMGLAPILLLFASLSMASSHAMAEDQQFEIPTEEFLTQAFSGQVPKPAVLWLTGTLKEEVATILGHKYPSLRVRYWRQDQRIAWVLEEIGKDRPITAGFITDDTRLEDVQVLAFRETRGGEIRFKSFTHQFDNAGLKSSGRLDRRIDGISGATLSVNAMRKLAAMALLLTQHVMK